MGTQLAAHQDPARTMPGELENGDLGGLENIADLGSLGDLEDFTDVGTLENVGDLGSVGGLEDVGGREGIGGVTTLENIGDLRSIGGRESAGDLGEVIEIRPARMDDEERIRCFLAGLSTRTQTQRFFTGVNRPSASMVRALLTVDERRDALLAVRGELLVGHAMSYRGEGTDIEIAVVVGDEWQGRGVGARLVRRLLHRASVGGARTLGMDVLGDNRKVLAMIRRAWPEATMKVSSGTVQVAATTLL
ncbi:Ribosomal protein S18 acetylase RimI [Streptosporangium subroseum]|uniref:Ribosomal protein S18 acetylase RimI n=2 Tax=Streptosporangium subroseum TaxID=106412 RepID=A0A239IQA8_9ACTN|nr:Ribosomal protein S18 acetylase RimI [Streptosporangium subroseum]